jgi:hypothetical protein
MDKNKSIDHQLRATWQAVAKLYNERAAKHDSTMATAFVLLNIDYEKGTPFTAQPFVFHHGIYIVWNHKLISHFIIRAIIFNPISRMN